MEGSQEDTESANLANRIQRLQFKSTPNIVNDQPEIISTEEEAAVFFEDCRRRIDFVLVYEKEESKTETEIEKRKERIRDFFHQSMKTLGLELEFDVQRKERHESVMFVKVHAPFKLLCRKAEKLKVGRRAFILLGG